MCRFELLKKISKTMILYFKYSTECDDILYLLQGLFSFSGSSSNPVIGTISKILTPDAHAFTTS